MKRTVFIPEYFVISTETASDQWLAKDSRTPKAGAPYPLTSTAVKRRRGDDGDSEQGETPAGSEVGSERDFEDT